LINTQNRVLGSAGYITLEAEDGHRMPGRGCYLVNMGFGFGLHDR